MLTRDENELLTRVTGDAPMGRLMRHHCWMPFARDVAIVRGQPPQRVRLLGENLVAFRGEDGCVGLVEERCPHRGASLALARIEGCSLRCLYHGWRTDGTGGVVEIPSQGARANAPEVARMSGLRTATREAGGLVWAYLGGGDPPPFPQLPFLHTSPEMRFIARTIMPCNWLQALEGGLDSAHVGWLHRSWFPAGGEVDRDKIAASPSFRTKDTGYGLRAAAIRDLPGGGFYVRIAELLMPFTTLLRTDRPTSVGAEYSSFMTVPIDDESHLLFWYIWNPDGPLSDSSYLRGDYDLDNYATLSGPCEAYWGQDHAAMEAGHFSGFTRMLIQEDVAAQVSMGPIADRTRDHLCATDVAIVRTRRQLLRLVRAFEHGEDITDVFAAYAREGHLPFVGTASGAFEWNDTEAETA